MGQVRPRAQGPSSASRIGWGPSAAVREGARGTKMKGGGGQKSNTVKIPKDRVVNHIKLLSLIKLRIICSFAAQHIHDIYKLNLGRTWQDLNSIQGISICK